MLRRSTILAVALLALVLLEQVWAANDHAAGACPAQSWDSKAGPDQFWWKALTSCNDHDAQELQHGINLQWFDWDDSLWKDRYVSPTFLESSLNTDFLAESRYRTVDTYYGLLCYRIRTYHSVFEHTKGFRSQGNSYSWSRCF